MPLGEQKAKLEKIKTHGKARSPEWPAKKREFAKKHPKVCAVCGRKTRLQLHHILPFHLYPGLELEDSNLIWLCENNPTIDCHLKFGHLGSFRNKFNPYIREEAQEWLRRFQAKTEQQALPAYKPI